MKGEKIMKKMLFLAFAVLFLTFAVTTPWADTSKEESALEQDVQELDSDSAQGGAVVNKLVAEFKVDEAVIKGLRDKKLGYGEIAITLSLADKLEGGITGANIDKILAMRGTDGKTGWGNIAGKLGIKLGPVISDIERVKPEKTDGVSKTSVEKAGKAERPDKMEKPERPERPEKPEKPGRGDK